MSTAAAPAWRLDFDGAELSWARPAVGGWLLRFAVVPAQALRTTEDTTACAGHALGVVLTLHEATAATDGPPASAPDTWIGRCRALHWWPDHAATAPGTPGAAPWLLPSTLHGPGRLLLELAQGGRLSLRGRGLAVDQPDGPRWVEHLHC